ncbi:MAG: pyruvoyl-dependent arginine decarboxylase [Promethearchaeota archaeon]
MIPKRVFFTKGVGKGKHELQSFEMALRDAGIAQFNLVQVSSILPPNCMEITREEGLEYLKDKTGSIIFCVLSRNCSNEKNRTISASIGIAKPKDSNSYGYLSEYHSFGNDENETGAVAEEIAACMLASTLGIQYDEMSDFNAKKEIFLKSNKIIETKNITATAIVKEDKVYTTVISCAVFLME